MSDKHKDWENQREAMWLGSKNKTFYHTKEVTKTVRVKMTLEEFRETLIKNSPLSIMSIDYSIKKPAIHITKMINPSDEGVTFYHDAWADKTPKTVTFEEFYNKLNVAGGLDSYRF